MGVLASKKHLGGWSGQWGFLGGESKRAECREDVCVGPWLARGQGFGGNVCDRGLSPLCSKGEEAEKGFGAGEGLSPCSTSPGDAQARDPQQEQEPTLLGGGRKERGEICWGNTKNPGRCNSKGLQMNAALGSGNGGKQKSLGEKGEWGKE